MVGSNEGRNQAGHPCDWGGPGTNGTEECLLQGLSKDLHLTVAVKEYRFNEVKSF